ncbi:hypothetical protein AA101099_2730 [Neoasaia chiangmaiensis NBRC 101099]|uniref:Uncharacterized protein n=1 Tax=Neoasaia chiangmaiensis TaxID=320497 RepID=A0A1U9KPA5_9PROT|nr:hypothetical protein [Neoasaia chiangmaiensis]AQS87627.1 hypothetical protein A0U93_06405 [Neoasaia chiangmaiensis]GBR42069.1 hypothetical protein AA101099_2730 [Neoasaia chiangmaiensis NBRC 101099]GEN14193.1 hypothetical protein NCH01_06240 [Neoasaia chiangmaiensis]
MRRLFPVFALAFLSGCGFQPLYGSTGNGKPEVAQQMQDVFVANIPERTGQALRLALQEAMGGASSREPNGYTLQVSPGFSAQAIDIHGDNTSGRTRELGTAHWRLFTVEQTPRLLAEGDASTLDGYSPTFEQYFAQTLDQENTDTRVAQTLAANITQQVAVWFRTHNKPATGNAAEVPSYFDPNAMPNANGQPYEKAGPDGFPAAATGRTDMNDHGE